MNKKASIMDKTIIWNIKNFYSITYILEKNWNISIHNKIKRLLTSSPKWEITNIEPWIKKIMMNFKNPYNNNQIRTKKLIKELWKSI